MSNIRDRIDAFITEHVNCTTCRFFIAELIGGVCNGPELPLGYMTYTESMCEQHEFRDPVLARDLVALQDIWYEETYLKEITR